MRARPLALVLCALGVLAPAACVDPVRDQALAALPPEDPGGPSPDHRRGQPCLLCHDKEGGAQPEMVVAGTVYLDPTPDAPGAENVEVEFVDATGGGPLYNPVTFRSGNFFVARADWPDITFPFKTRLKQNGEVAQIMQSTVNREGSCNFCHRPNPPEPYTDRDRELARQSFGQIYLNAGAP